MTALLPAEILLPMTLQLITTQAENSVLWEHPTLALTPPQASIQPQRAYLYRTPSHFGEHYAFDDLPQPTPSERLPSLSQWIPTLAMSVLEIWAGRRQPMQIADKCHRVTYSEIQKRMGMLKEVGRVKSIHICEPLDGLCEAVIGVAFKERYRSLAIRAEGVDGRWLCTEIDLL
jgi:hypothetical protein